jgi:hypothetical protein
MALIDLDLKPPPKTLRTFGIAALVVFGGFGLWIRLKGGLPIAKFPESAPTVSLVLWIVGGLSGLFALVKPEWNRPLYVALVLVSFPIGLVVSFLVLIIIFYGLMTPLNLAFKLMGRDAMNRRVDPSASTYWQPHQAPETVNRYFKQF